MAKSNMVIRGTRDDTAELYLAESTQVKKLTTALMGSISLGLQKGLSPKDACAIAMVSPHLYDNWYEAGKALLEGRSHIHIPELIPKQPHEAKSVYRERKEQWKVECNLLVHFFLLCNQSKQQLNEKMLTTIVEYAESDHIDSWKAAREVLKMTGGMDYNKEQRPAKQQHEHVVTGEVVHTHRDEQIHILIENLRAVAGTALPEGKKGEDIIEGEIISPEEDSA